MKLWIGGESQSDIADAFRLARNELEKTVNQLLAQTDYKLPVTDWDCIAIVRDDTVFSEMSRYSKAKKKMDFRLVVPYSQFTKASHQEQVGLLFSMLLRSLSILDEKTEEHEQIRLLVNDLQRLGKEKEWIH